MIPVIFFLCKCIILYDWSTWHSFYKFLTYCKYNAFQNFQYLPAIIVGISLGFCKKLRSIFGASLGYTDDKRTVPRDCSFKFEIEIKK